MRIKRRDIILKQALDYKISVVNLVAILGALGIIIGSVAIAIAAIPDTNGVINACYNNKGALRVIDTTTEACTTNETALNWNQTGPTGPPGPAGASGILAYGRVTISDAASGYLPVLDATHSNMIDQISYGSNYNPTSGSRYVCVKLSASASSTFTGGNVSNKSYGNPNERGLTTRYDRDISSICNQFTADLYIESADTPEFDSDEPFTFNIY